MQAYSDPKRASDPHALPNIKRYLVFHHEHAKRERCFLNAGHKAELYGECITDEDGDCLGTGWYWWSCFPGFMPDSDPFGPFESYEAALADAQQDADNDDDDDN